MQLSNELAQLNIDDAFCARYHLHMLSLAGCAGFDRDGLTIAQLPACFERVLARAQILPPSEARHLHNVTLEHRYTGRVGSLYHADFSDIKRVTGALVQLRRAVGSHPTDAALKRASAASLLMNRKHHQLWIAKAQVDKRADAQRKLYHLIADIQQQGEFLAFPACKLPATLELLQQRIRYLKNALHAVDGAVGFFKGILIYFRSHEDFIKLKQLKSMLQLCLQQEQQRKGAVVNSALLRLHHMSTTGQHDQFGVLINALQTMQELDLDAMLSPYDSRQLGALLDNASFDTLHQIVMAHGTDDDINNLLQLRWFHRQDVIAAIPTYRIPRLSCLLPAFRVSSVSAYIAWIMSYFFDSRFWGRFILPKVIATGRINDLYALACKGVEHLLDTAKDVADNGNIFISPCRYIEYHPAWQAIVVCEVLLNAQLSQDMGVQNYWFARVRGDRALAVAYCRALKTARDEKLLLLKMNFLRAYIGCLNDPELSDELSAQFEALLTEIENHCERLSDSHPYHQRLRILRAEIEQHFAKTPLDKKLKDPKTGKYDDNKLLDMIKKDRARFGWFRSSRAKSTGQALVDDASKKTVAGEAPAVKQLLATLSAHEDKSVAHHVALSG